MLLSNLYSWQLKLLISRYSRGEDVEVMRQGLPDLVGVFVAYSREPGYAPFLLDEMSGYVQVLWLLSLTLLLEIDRDLVRDLVRTFDVTGQDALVDRLIAALGFLEGAASDRVIHPRPYEFLVRALDAQGTEQQQEIARFLKGYYRGMRHTYWFDRHLRPDTGFFGYWSFELAACVRIADIDDHSFADNIYYPRDLVAWSRQCPTSSL
jgi:hypothetical protein